MYFFSIFMLDSVLDPIQSHTHSQKAQKSPPTQAEALTKAITYKQLGRTAIVHTTLEALPVDNGGTGLIVLLL